MSNTADSTQVREKVLVVTSVASMADQFLIPSFRVLQELGYEVHLACNFEKGNNCTPQRVADLKERLEGMDVTYYHVDFARNVSKLVQNYKAYKQLKAILRTHVFRMIHCTTPIGGVVTRFAARPSRRRGARVLYSAHGFHFFKGAPLKNWLLYYPVERICSRMTDVLITTNREDQALSERRMKAKRRIYIPGVGLDLSRFDPSSVDRLAKRRELGIPEHALLLLSVGELNSNKNHATVIRALAHLTGEGQTYHYAVAGVGEKAEELRLLAEELGVGDRVHLLGFRTDVPALCYAADVFCFPSFREGQGMAALEAMAAGLPLITSNVHGINDYSIHGQTGYKYSPSDVEGFAEGIASLGESKTLREEMGAHNLESVKQFELSRINAMLRTVYEETAAL